MNKLHLKMWRSLTAVVLTICMAFGSAGTALAAESEGEGKKSYVSLGDSMTNGYCLDGYYYQDAENPDGENVNGYLQEAPEAYPAQVAEAMGWDLTQLAISAMRAEDLHFILEYGTNGAYAGDEYTKNEFTDDRFKDFEEVKGKEYLAGVDEVAKQFQTSVKDADVISVAIGNANFGVFLLGRITNALGVLGATTDGDDWIRFEDALALCDEETKAAALAIYEQVKAAVVSHVPAEQTEQVDILTNVIGYTVVSYVLNYNGVLDRIVELNPDAEIMIVGIMNTMSGLDVSFEMEGQTYTIDMGTIMAPVIESVNLYLAALPAAKQALDVYTDATFYYAEASNVDMLVNGYAVAAEDWKKYPIVRDRFIEEVVDTVFPMLDMEQLNAFNYKNFKREDVEEYEAAVGEGDAAVAAYAQKEPNKAMACAIYLAFEKAVVDASQLDTLNAKAFVKLGTGLDGIFEDVIAGYEANAAAAIEETYYLRVVESVVLPGLQKQNSELTLGDAVELLKTEEGKAYQSMAVSVCTLLATPDALSSALIADETVAGLLNLFARMLIGNGIGCHPSATGHDTITNAILESYKNGYTATDSVTDKVTVALENLYDLLVEYGPDAIEDAYTYAEENGYIDQLKNAAEELIAKAEAELKNYAQEVKPEIEAAIAELEEQLAALEKELAEKKAELDAKLEELKTLLEEKKAELENASAELKAEIEAAIEEIEAAIAEIQAIIEALEEAVAEIEAKIAEIKAAIDELEGKLAEIAEDMEALSEAATELKAAIAELVQIAEGKVEGSVEETIAAIQAAIAKVGEAVEAAESLAEAVNAVISGTVSLAKDIIADVARLEQVVEDLKAELENAAEELIAELEGAVEELATELIGEASKAIEEATSKLYADVSAKLEQVVDQVVAEFNAAYADATTGEYTVSDDSCYVALGDSSVIGFGLDNSEDNYAYKLAGELGLDVSSRFVNLSEYGMSAENCRRTVADNADVIAKSDLITLGFSNNTFTTFVAEQLMAVTTGREPDEMDWSRYVGAEGIPYIEDVLKEINAYFLESGLDAAYADLMTLAVESYAYGYVGYVCHYPELVNDIRAINPDALVIIVGMYNPLENTVIKVNDTEVAIGEYVGYLVELTKLHTTAYAMLTSAAVYVDAPDVETIKSASDMDVMGFVAEYVYFMGESMHAGENGHEYIKEQILNALTITEKEEASLIGDVNLDGVVNSSDTTLLYRYVQRYTALNEQQLKNADVNNDGVVNSSDTTLLYRYVQDYVSAL